MDLRSRFHVVAHRGASLRAPENTVPAFDLALVHRATGIEFDLRRTLDGVLLAIHDEELFRTISLRGRPCSGRVGDWLARDLCLCSATATSRRGPTHGPPRFQEIVDRYAVRTELFVHLKDATADGVVEAAVASALPSGPHRVISSSKGVLREVKRRAPHLRCVLLIEDEPSFARIDATVDSLTPRAELVDAMAVRLARRHHLELIPHTVNEPGEVERLLELGVDGVITDDPLAVSGVADRWFRKALRPSAPVAVPA